MFLHGIKISIRTKIGSIKYLNGIYRLRNGNLVVANNTDIVIEGYPRSGNTFAVLAFQQAQNNDLIIGHHLHIVSQVVKAGICQDR